MWFVVSVIVCPYKTFHHLKHENIFGLAVLLTIIRWTVTPINTVWSMYLHDSPMLLPPLFGLDPQTYRYYEIFWYGPYGILMMLVITGVIFRLARTMTTAPELTLSKTYQLTSLAFFTPWLLGVVGDPILIHTVNAHPYFLVPFHIGILTVECFLLSLGFHYMFGIPFWRRCTLLGFIAGTLFVAMGAVAIR